MASLCFIILNAILALIGLAMIIFSESSVRGFQNPKDIQIPKLDKFKNLSLLTYVGIGIVIVAVVGIVGSLLKMKLLLFVYIVVMGVVVFAFLLLLILSAVFLFDLDDQLDKGLQEINKKFKREYWNDDKNPINLLQKNFKCCGIRNYTDYDKMPPPKDMKPEDVAKYPMTCCKTKPKSVEAQKCYTIENNIYKGGCFKKLTEELNGPLTVIFVVVLLVFLFSSMCLLFAIISCAC